MTTGLILSMFKILFKYSTHKIYCITKSFDLNFKFEIINY